MARPSPEMVTDAYGNLNMYPEYTALKSFEKRMEEANHPSEIIDPNDPRNFYNYSWTS